MKVRYFNVLIHVCVLELEAYIRAHVSALADFFADIRLNGTNRRRYSYFSLPNSVPLFDEIPGGPAVQKDGTVRKWPE